jgi:hypothetical protein
VTVEPPATPPTLLTPPVKKAKPTVTKKVAPKPKPKPKPVVKAKPKPKPKPAPKPKVAPKPKPVPEVCATLGLSTKAIPAGQKTGVTFVVTAAGKPVAGAKVRLKGPGIFKTVETGKRGRIATVLTASEAGIVNVTVIGRKGCNAKRIGVVAPSFEPPVTG